MISYQMRLDYALQPGRMAPYFDALREGQALGRRCNACAAVSYPPLRICPCGERGGDWVRLSGRADVLWRATGADGDFALARFEGAARMATVRLRGFGDNTGFGQLAAADQDLPHLCLVPIEDGSA